MDFPLTPLLTPSSLCRPNPVAKYQASIAQLRQLHDCNKDRKMHPYIAVPAILALAYRAHSRKSLTQFGLVVAALTAVVHAVHPWSLPFALLAVFFLAGTTVTKVKHDIKARLTISANGSSGGEGARNHVQVLANSACASILTFLHYRQLKVREVNPFATNTDCWAYGTGDLLVVGIISNYAAVAADTFSSELGILSTTRPRLLTSWTFRPVPPGTNGGISPAGTLAGFAGAFIIALTSLMLLPFCEPDYTVTGKLLGGKPGFEGGSGWGWQEKTVFVAVVTAWGGLGSLLDSALGGWFQESVVDSRTGKIVEGVGGKKVLIKEARVVEGKRSDEPGSRRVESGMGLLDNNAVNALMAAIMSLGGMIVVGFYWELPISSVLG